MDHFQRQHGELYAEQVALEKIATEVGTPTYVYVDATITRHVRVLQEALKGRNHLICYAIKSNGNLSVLARLRALGCNFDAVSLGELERLRCSGADTRTAIFSGVGKRDDEIEAALRYGVRYICVESESELSAIAHIAQRINVVAPICIRVNPDVDAKTHPYIATGLKENKFGVPYDTCLDLADAARQSPYLDLVGVSCHIGSQITSLGPFVDAAARMRELALHLKTTGPLRYLGIGGGLGVPYNDETPPSPAEYGAAVAEALKDIDATLVLEPGRVIVANAGVLLSRVVRIKKSSSGVAPFVVLDAGMNDLMRPALYNANHRIEAVQPSSQTQEQTLVGPVCESSDTFCKNTLLPPLKEGDLVAIRSAGAYGFVMASTYNGRPLPAEVLVRDDTFKVVRRRQAIIDLWQNEDIPK